MGGCHADGRRSVYGGDEMSAADALCDAQIRIKELEQQLAEAKECLAWAFDLAESHDSYMTSAYKDCDRKWSVRCKKVLK